jgi:hypothetical protein
MVLSGTKKTSSMSSIMNKIQWIDVVFDFLDLVITGLITNIENDRIEVSVWNPTLKVMNETIFIDFEYKGLPLDSHIKQILRREKPDHYTNDKVIEYDNLEIQETETETEEPETEEFHLPDKENVHEALQRFYIDANDIIFDDKVEKLSERIEKDDKYIRYSLDSQIAHIVDDLLSTIPNYKRTSLVLDNVHRIVERYTQLR